MSGSVIEEGAELEALLERAAPEAAKPEFQVVPVPVTITVKDVAATFTVPEPSGWAYTQLGVFATGHWRGTENTEHDVLIPYGEIKLLEYHYPKEEAPQDDGSEQPAE